MNSTRIFGLAGVLVLSNCGMLFGRSASRIARPTPVTQASPAAPKKAEEQFKNIQVLKGVPADQIFPTMQFISASLGVECDFCHVQNAFDKDDKKPKQIARKMMEMMFAINKDNFEGHREVTCNSCHRGSPHPAAIPTVMSEPAAPPASGAPHGTEDHAAAETKPNASPTADQLLDKYVQAAGGAAAIDKITSRVMTGKIDFGGRSLPIDIYAKDSRKRSSFVHMADGDNVTVFNGQDGWLTAPGRPVHDMLGNEVDGAAIDADLHLATHFKQMFSGMEVKGTERIGDHDTYVLIGKRDAKPPIQLYFDQQSGLLVRLVRFGDTALGLLPTQVDYADYREANGVKVPYRWTLARPAGVFTIQISELRQNVPVDDAKFAKPPSGEPAKPGSK